MRARVVQQHGEGIMPSATEPPPSGYPPVGGVWTRDDVIRLTVEKATQHGLVPWELLGGMIAEGLDVYASRPPSMAQWRRYWNPPNPFDVSFGLGQAAVRYTEEYAAWCRSKGINPESKAADAYPGDDVIGHIRDIYFDPFHALDVAAPRYRYWRYGGSHEDTPLTAWVAYNSPGYYHNPESSPNVGNYRDGLAEARRILGIGAVTPGPAVDRVYCVDTPDAVVLQHNQWSCAVRTTYAMLWMAQKVGAIPGDPVITYGDGGVRDVYDLLVPKYDTSDVGLHDHTGRGIVEALATWGIKAQSMYPASLVSVQRIAGLKPAGIGGRNWNHWSAVRGLEADGTLILENPSPGWGGIYHELRDSFAGLGDDGGMMSLVYIDV